MEKEFHAVAGLFPLMHGAAFEELAADIKKNGLREPILCDAGGRILDGRNRYRACVKAGVKPRFVTWKGEGALPELALSLNLRRRHLDESQRALVAARLAAMLATEALKRKGKRTDLGANLPPGSGKSREKAAAEVSVSPRLVTYALKVLKNGCPELIAAVESGESGAAQNRRGSEPAPLRTGAAQNRRGSEPAPLRTGAAQNRRGSEPAPLRTGAAQNRRR